MRRGRLPLATAPRPDELLTSYLTRLAQDHYIKVYTFCQWLFPGVNVWNRDVDRSAPGPLLHAMSQWTGVRGRRTQRLLLTRYEGRLYLHHNALGNTNWVLPLGIYHRTRRGYGLLYCPGCLRGDGDTPYFRTRWRLALSVACPRCRLALRDRCPRCGQPVIFFRRDLGHKWRLSDRPLSHCFQCGYDLGTGGEPSSRPVVAAQREWYRILRHGWRPTVAYPHLYFAVLHRLATALGSPSAVYHPLQRAVRAAGVPGVGTQVEYPCGKVLERWPLAARTHVLLQAAWLLDEWPDRFVAFMKRHRIASTPLLRDMSDSPFWYESVVTTHLYRTNENRHFHGFWEP